MISYCITWSGARLEPSFNGVWASLGSGCCPKEQFRRITKDTISCEDTIWPPEVNESSFLQQKMHCLCSQPQASQKQLSVVAWWPDDPNVSLMRQLSAAVILLCMIGELCVHSVGGCRGKVIPQELKSLDLISVCFKNRLFGVWGGEKNLQKICFSATAVATRELQRVKKETLFSMHPFSCGGTTFRRETPMSNSAVILSSSSWRITRCSHVPRTERTQTSQKVLG